MKKLLVLVICLGFVACKTDPYSDSNLHETKQPPPPQKSPLSTMALIVPSMMEFEEGVEREYGLSAQVGAPAKPLLSVSGLPNGATFSDTSLRLKWTPDFEAANDAKDTTVVIRTYSIEFILRSSDDPATALRRQANLIVRDKARKFEVALQGSTYLYEGRTYKRKVKISSEDFPAGPFDIFLQGLPSQATFQKDAADPSLYTLTYTPGFDEATVKDKFLDFYGHIKELSDIKIRALAPRGQAELSLTWAIIDRRQMPRISAPTKLAVAGEAFLTVNAEDMNGETTPAIRLIAQPPFGKVQLSSRSEDGIRGAQNPMSVASIRWYDIPPEKLGTTEKLNLAACTFGSEQNPSTKNLCKEHAVEVTFETVNTAPAPIVDRTDWPVSVIKYLRETDTLTVKLRINAAESPSMKVKVEALFDNSKADIKWDKHKLELKARSSGLLSITLTATTVAGGKRVENFVAEILPANWKPILTLGDSLTDLEVLKTKQVFDSDVVNPVLQPLNERTLALRTTLVAGTSLLQKDSDALVSVETAFANAKNGFIATPLVASFRGPVQEELKKLGLTLAGRLLEKPNPGTLDEYKVLQQPQLATPSQSVTLSGKLTSESKSPLLFTRETGSVCEPALELQRNGQTEKFLLAVSCPRANGGRFVIAGFEWTDLVFQAADEPLLKTWAFKLVFP